jgi:RNA polymerase sigma-70 factor (ECF subfamily)
MEWKAVSRTGGQLRNGSAVIIVEDSNKNDGAAIDTLSREYRSVLQRYFLRRGLPQSDVEDLVQDVFVRLSRRKGLSGMASVEGYLFETAASVAIDYWRGARRRGSLLREPYDEARHAIEDFGPDRILAGREALGTVVEGLLELPERTRNVFILARLEQLRHAEIARRLGISVSAVEKHLIKAFAHLAKCVGVSR